MKKLPLFIAALILSSVPVQARSFFPDPELPDQLKTRESDAQQDLTGKSRFTVTPLPELTGCCTGISDLSILRRPEVRSALFTYLTDGRTYAARGIGRADLYMRDVDRVFAQYPAIPREITALPLLESGYSPFAVSRMKAVGAWQIIAPTARSLGIKIDTWTDGRRDIAKSTDAALRHLSHLYTAFGSWEFALAAYNGGGSRVSSAVRKNKSRDFWFLVENNAFRKETNDYIPHYAALALIYYNRELFGFGRPTMDTVLTEEYTLLHPVRIDELARIADAEPDAIYRLNPELISNITPPDRGAYCIRLPAGSADKIAGRESELYRVKFSKLAKHRIRKGDSIHKIAKRYGTDPDRIIYINAIQKPYYLRAGKDIYIPLS
ncbi:MAG: transglycosylase SLT domain-containing protein [Spirochaetota bacterium]